MFIFFKKCTHINAQGGRSGGFSAKTATIAMCICLNECCHIRSIGCSATLWKMGNIAAYYLWLWR